MKRYTLIPFLLLIGLTVFGQSVSDAVRYSNLQPGGSARFMGAGGAFSALGADFGVLSTNPAGLAMFRTDELVLTPAIRFTNTDAELPGVSNYATTDEKSNFNFNSIGLVFNSEPRASEWTNFNFGIGFNRQQNFHQSIYYEGLGNGTIMNGWFNSAAQTLNNGGSADDLYPFGEQMAYNTNGIYYQDGVLTYDFAANPDAEINRTQSIVTTGGVNEMVFSFAGNYNERLLVGATIGAPFVNYRLDAVYDESDPGFNVDYFDNLSYTEFLRTNGIGVNLKLGVILRVNQAFRLGAAFHSPTFMAMTDNYSNTLSYTYTDGNGSSTGQAESPEGTSDYRFRTPVRAMGGASVLIGKYGFLSGDIEWVDYSAARYNFTADVNTSENKQFERELNTEIQRQLKPTLNFRVGGELALAAFRLRAGLNLLGKPYEGDTGFNTAITTGVGIRGESFYLDLGYRLQVNNGNVQPYSDAPIAATTTRSNDLLLTLGFKF